MLYLGGDHAGYKLKKEIKKYLDKKQIAYQDIGPLQLVPIDDYPDYGFKVAKKVAKNLENRGILICGSSVGVCIVANKVKGIRAGSVTDVELIKFARAHDDMNVLCLSGWNTPVSKAQKIIDAFLRTPFSGEARHIRRIHKITRIENN